MESTATTSRLPSRPLPAPPDPPLFLKVKEAAKIIQISERKMWGFLRSNTGPKYRRFGRALRIPYKSFLEWVEKDHKSPPPGY